MKYSSLLLFLLVSLIVCAQGIEPNCNLDHCFDDCNSTCQTPATTLETYNMLKQSGTMRPMNITMISIGSRGDVQPYIALAKGLQKDGHNVKIATHEEFRSWVIGHGIKFAPLAGNPAVLMVSGINLEIYNRQRNVDV